MVSPIVRSVAIIGAGPSGLVTARALLAENTFNRIVVYERRDAPGGVWNYSTETPTNFPYPNSNPNLDVKPITHEGRSPLYPSALYRDLHTNTPIELMTFSIQNFPENTEQFPHRKDVLEYQRRFAEPIRTLIKTSTEVRRIHKQGGQWLVHSRNVSPNETNAETVEQFDAVAICNGHYQVPFLPDVEGLKEFVEENPGVVKHSIEFREPELYRNKKVVVVGNASSANDIIRHLSPYSKLPIIQSVLEDPQTKHPERLVQVPRIERFDASTKQIHLSDGRVLRDVDYVFYCTGYLYSLPFFDEQDVPSENRLITNGAYVHNVYQHIFYIPDPTLVFIGLALHVVPFPVAQAQAAWVARVWSGRLRLPSREQQLQWYSEHLSSLNGRNNMFHSLEFPKDAAYINHIHDLVSKASPNPETGLPAPHWDEKSLKMRENMWKIRAKFFGIED
ncbi:flavin dependent monooxygenase [Schizosaccharomyces japonicus yFS275]|uniref:Flavin dependent monooxygenase n=1 Tax=Schizosaccharomyces japonicus (strain yFS275 / FY16936) TaxID=402676 RepID=B6K799_SCHJY|nr:flavin dependent monooxygenase [Schizosaccharomyces japonicus yFS275]EEB09403.1 flavin dependent monooxygenase [Schizosaccharomyces japonicus yFS275]